MNTEGQAFHADVQQVQKPRVGAEVNVFKKHQEGWWGWSLEKEIEVPTDWGVPALQYLRGVP